MSSASSELTFVVTAYQADEGSRKQRLRTRYRQPTTEPGSDFPDMAGFV